MTLPCANRRRIEMKLLWPLRAVVAVLLAIAAMLVYAIAEIVGRLSRRYR